MKITQKTIAQKAGVSQSTVSLVLNGLSDNNIPAGTVKKVLNTAERMGYRRRAVPLKKDGNHIKNIGYFDFMYDEQDFTEKQYFPRFVSEIMSVAEKKKYHIAVYKNYSYLMQAVFNNLLDGVVITEWLTEREIKTIKTHIPAVYLNCQIKTVPLDSVMPDNKNGIKKAVSRLYSLGHRNIALFGMKPLHLHSEERMQGYLDAMNEYRLKIREEYIRIPTAKKTGDVREVTDRALQTLKFWHTLKNIPTAVVTFGDCYALSLIKTAGNINLHLPRELSVIGFDNRAYCRYSTPSLSSIEQPMEAMAEKAMNLLSERMANPGKPVENVVFDVELIERESICPNNKKRD
jgi:LacI family transcriptional regulator